MAGRSGEWSYATSNHPSRDDPGRDARLLDARATLRLLFSPQVADRLARLSDRPDPGQSLRRLIDLARPRYLLRSWQARLPGGSAGEAPPLGPGRGIGSRPALALALQLGLNVTGDQLSDLFRRSDEEIGEDLYDARRALDPKLAMPCPEQIPALGRHRDPSLYVNERIGLLRHTADCASCRAVLERFQQIDGELLEELSRQRDELVSQPLPGLSLPSRLVASPAALIVIAVLVLILVVGGAGFGVSHLAGNHHNPVPLIVAAASPDATAQAGAARPTGWLILQTTDDGVEAVNLTTAEHRTIVPGTGVQGGGSFQLLSPNLKLLATLGPEQSNGTQPIPVVIRRLDGTVVANHQLDYSSDSIPWLLGWLDNQTILVGEEPVSRLNSPPVPLEVVTNAINIRSWRSHRFFTGDVSQFSISPDGKLALVMHEGDSNWKGQTVELRPVLPGGAGLGAPLATIEHRGLASTLNTAWAPDSSRVYLSRIDDAIIQLTPSSTPGASYEPPKHVSIVAIDRQGHISTVLAPNTDALAMPIAISADGRTIYYEYALSETTGNNSDQSEQASLWSAGIGGENRKKLGKLSEVTGPPSLLIAGWDPGTFLVIGGQEPYLNGDQPATIGGGPLAWPVVDVYRHGSNAVPILSLPDVTSYQALAWLSENTLPNQASAAATSQTGTNSIIGQPSAPESVPEVVDDYTIADDSSAVSGDDRYVVLTNLTDHSPEIIDRSNPRSWRELDSDDTDPSWLPNHDILISASRPSAYGYSRLKLSAPSQQEGVDYPIYDAAQFDPINLVGTQSSAVYTDPIVSPDGLSTAFFVLDRNGNNTALWLAQAGHPAQAVDHWSDGTKQSGSLPLLATWVDSRTLLYAMPGSWQRNLPQQPELVRLTIHPDGTFEQKVLLTLPKSGFDRGIAVAGMTLSRDGTHLALRVRHYGHADHKSGVSDAIVVMPARDLGQRVQIEQAAPGSGLSWSPSGDWLAFGLNSKVEIASANGASLHQVALPTGTTGASPLWVGSNEIWFTQDNGVKRELRRVIVR